MFGGNENDRNHVRQFVSRVLGSIAQKINGAVLLCAHPSRTGLNKGADGAEGDSGSTGWSNSLRSRLFLRTPSLDNGEVPDPNARVLQRKKANYATRNDEIKLCWRNGVIEPEVPVSPGATAFGKIDVKDVFVALLDEFATAKRNVSADALLPAIFAPRIFGNLGRHQRHNTQGRFQPRDGGIVQVGRDRKPGIWAAVRAAPENSASFMKNGSVAVPVAVRRSSNRDASNAMLSLWFSESVAVPASQLSQLR